ncbi:Asparagine--tRNA ligase [Hondaea fermentalgiana]|uniref:asparagine--tRNA ligase n=1 Tax=Hondaea fermentalgiana TaxID=2315210 RepID=A0A2R5G4F5_9STRA|nr:Asparagine--tRNA ligase [Hondaea fermentalgiana]|eukprot:GBG24668.1 Asparagine--tRNA ligase [Hondaea fermentalgiana]
MTAAWVLHALPGDNARTLRVQSAAKLTGTEMETKLLKNAPKKGTSPTNKLPALWKGSDGCAAFSSVSAMKLLARAADGADSKFLGGADAATKAEVDQWMEYAVDVLDPLAEVACLKAGTSLAKVAGDAADEVTARSTKALVDEVCAVVDKKLRKASYLVGDALTFADVAVASALVGPLRSAIEAKPRQSKLSNVSRWFETILKESSMDACLESPFSFYAGKAAQAAAAGEAAAKAAAKATSITGAAMGAEQVPMGKLFKRSHSRVKDILETDSKTAVGKTVSVCGWARTVRSAGKGSLAFVELNDGSCQASLQVVCSAQDTTNFDQLVGAGGVGSSHRFVGTLVAPQRAEQAIELKADIVEVLGTVDPKEYPLSKTGNKSAGHSVEFLREQAHLRARTNLIACVARVRNACAFAIHDFFRLQGFQYVHTPIITASDCEGAGEMMAVTTMLGKAEENKGKLPTVTAELAKKYALDDPNTKLKEGDVDYTKDFFSKPAFLTVSGQLNVETYACALSDVYTFGPTFRAENSHTSRHLAEFWMVEPELCFASLKDDIDLAEDFIKYCTQYVLKNCAADIDYFEKHTEEGLRDRLLNVVDTPFKRLSYTEAIEILNKPEHLKTEDGSARFEEHPAWGIDLGSEHERYLCEKVFKGPVVLTDYPADIKAFYMRQNELDKEGRLTVQAMDILVPRIGELVGGSAREERLGLLEKRITDMNLKPEDFSWYCDLRRFGTVPHAGFGLGFDRFVMFVTGIANIRDVIPFPRYPGVCAF